MLLKISHITEYVYSGAVFFEPHYFRLKPKFTPHSIVRDFAAVIDPKPAGTAEQIDIENNHTLLSWFDGEHSALSIKANSVVEAWEYNPYNFLVHPSQFLRIPFAYDSNTRQLLNSSLQPQGIPEPMMHYLKAILKTTLNQSIDFLASLTQSIHQTFTLKTRETGEPRKPELTFELKEGSCRDLAWMQIQMLRQLGIAARFVSGYFYIDNTNPQFELHAWVEVFLPGAGWIGLDPSHGILAGAHHIPVASSAFYENTMPVSGTVRGSANAVLKNELNISYE